MVEAPAVMAAIIGDWVDFSIIVFMLVFNGVLGFWEESTASNALSALKNSLALTAKALRKAAWGDVPARDLVPGDIVRVRLGDVIPADGVLLEGDYLDIDQSALTGESLSVSKKGGDVVYSGSIVKKGEMTLVVTATGTNTFFGRTAKLVASAGTKSHLQEAVVGIGNFLIILTLALAAVLIVDQLAGCAGISRRTASSASRIRPRPARGGGALHHARRPFRHDGARREDARHQEGHRLPAGIHRGTRGHRHPLLRQNRHAHTEQAHARRCPAVEWRDRAGRDPRRGARLEAGRQRPHRPRHRRRAEGSVNRQRLDAENLRSL